MMLLVTTVGGLYLPPTAVWWSSAGCLQASGVVLQAAKCARPSHRRSGRTSQARRAAPARSVCGSSRRRRIGRSGGGRKIAVDMSFCVLTAFSANAVVDDTTAFFANAYVHRVLRERGLHVSAVRVLGDRGDCARLAIQCRVLRERGTPRFRVARPRALHDCGEPVFVWRVCSVWNG